MYDASAIGDPHLNLPHGGKADFRGEHKTLYNFLSAKGLSLNVMTELADFELHAADNARHKDVHGSFLTQARFARVLSRCFPDARARCGAACKPAQR